MKALCLLPNVVLLLASIMYEWKVGYVSCYFAAPFVVCSSLIGAKVVQT